MRSTISNKCVRAEETIRMSLLLVRCLSSLSSRPVARMQMGFLCTAGRNLMRSLSSLGLLSKGVRGSISTTEIGLAKCMHYDRPV